MLKEQELYDGNSLLLRFTENRVLGTFPGSDLTVKKKYEQQVTVSVTVAEQ